MHSHHIHTSVADIPPVLAPIIGYSLQLQPVKPCRALQSLAAQGTNARPNGVVLDDEANQTCIAQLLATERRCRTCHGTLANCARSEISMLHEMKTHGCFCRFKPISKMIAAKLWVPHFLLTPDQMKSKGYPINL